MFSGKFLLSSAPWVQLLLAGGQVELTKINDILRKGVWIDRGEEKLEKTLTDVIQHSPQQEKYNEHVVYPRLCLV